MNSETKQTPLASVIYAANCLGTLAENPALPKDAAFAARVAYEAANCEKLIAEHAAQSAVAEALKSIHSLANDPAGSTLTLKEVFGTFQHGCGVPEIEGKRSIEALANLSSVRENQP